MLDAENKFIQDKKSHYPIICINCRKYLGSTAPGDNHQFERGGLCPFCGKDVNTKVADSNDYQKNH